MYSSMGALPPRAGAPIPKSSPGIGKQEKMTGKKEVESKAGRHQNPNRPPKGTLRDAYSLAAQEPPSDHDNGHNKQQQAPAIAIRRGVRAGHLHDRRSSNGV